MTWKISRSGLGRQELLVNESLFSLGNGYLGVRGNFEEGYQESFKSIRGTYINAFHDETEIPYGEKLHGFPDTQQKLLNIIDGQTIDIYIDNDVFSMFEGTIISFERNLHMDKGYSERIIHWKSPQGKEVKLHFRRMVSFLIKELFAINVLIEPVSDDIRKISIVSAVDGDVSNYVDKSDPRLASGHEKRLKVTTVKKQEEISIIKNTTYETKLEVVCAASNIVEGECYSYEYELTDTRIEDRYNCEGTKPISFTKYNIFTDTLRHQASVIDQAIEIAKNLKQTTFEELLTAQKEYLDDFWDQSDIKIEGDNKLQEGIRFNIFHLLQSVGKEPVSNIAAKGLSGEGYEGHYFWDAEIYIFPVFLLTNPAIAKNLLLYRYSILDDARRRAKEVGHSKGALFPWRTIAGKECSSFFPAGTAQYHISADIAYSFIQYYLTTKDEDFLKNYMAEVLFETARLWMDTGHFLNGQFRIDNVTGPDEYTCIVNNNYYTNVMAKYNLLWADKVYRFLKTKSESSFKELTERLGVTSEEASLWKRAGEKMYLPYDVKKKINPQDDTFLNKARWDLEHTPKENFPLLLHYHPLILYRYQVCKQADTVLAHFLHEDEEDIGTIKNSYDYYEKITTHDSSLSYCVFSIMASKLGYEKKAYDYFNRTARLDLDNTHGNTKDGLHMANMGGTWLAIVYGFAGLRIKESGLWLSPSLPQEWNSLVFHIHFQDCVVKVEIEQETVTYLLKVGDHLSISHYGTPMLLEKGVESTVSIEHRGSEIR